MWEGRKGETTMEIDLDVGINEIADRGQESSPCCHSGKLCWVTEHFIFVVEQQQAKRWKDWGSREEWIKS